MCAQAEPSALGTVINEIKVKTIKKPEKYEELNSTDRTGTDRMQIQLYTGNLFGFKH